MNNCNLHLMEKFYIDFYFCSFSPPNLHIFVVCNQGMAVVAARATRLPIYSSFAKEGNLSDLFAKGEAISTVFNVLGLGAGIQLVSTVCSSMQGKV